MRACSRNYTDTFVCFPSLAIAEMKTLLKDVYTEFSTTPHISMTEEAMAMSDQLISSRPLGQKCLLHFHPVPGAQQV